MAKTEIESGIAEDTDPFAGVTPAVAERLTDPRPVEINPAAAAFVGQSFDTNQVLEIEATDENHVKTLVKHLRAAAKDEGVALRVKVIGLTVRFKASEMKARAERFEGDEPSEG